jgi:hypothetical protein
VAGCASAAVADALAPARAQDCASLWTFVPFIAHGQWLAAQDGALGMSSWPARAKPRLLARLAVITCALLAVASDAEAAQPPRDYTGLATSTSESSTVLNGSVDPLGQATAYEFEYGLTGAYGLRTPRLSVGSSSAPVKVSQSVTALQPGTTYHYRVVAVSSAGTTNGLDRTFSTTRRPLTLQVDAAPNPLVFGSRLIVQGTLAGTGAANRPVVLQANPFPYLAGFQSLAHTITDAAGRFSIPFPLGENSQLRVVAVDGSTVFSTTFIQAVAVNVTLHARRTRRRGFVRLYGTVTPAEAGALVGFQLSRPPSPPRIVSGAVVEAKGFSRILHIRHRGFYRAFVQVRNDGAHVSSSSAPVLIR